MKEKFYITEEGNKRRKVEGNAHEIKLANGETVKVFTHKACGKKYRNPNCYSEIVEDAYTEILKICRKAYEQGYADGQKTSALQPSQASGGGEHD